MDGMSATDGKSLGGLEHLRQSIADILRTPIGSRVMRREYGSDLFRLVDAPLNRSTVLRLYAATASALKKWEPRFKLTKIRASAAASGTVSLDLTGEYLPDGQTVTVDGVVVN